MTKTKNFTTTLPIQIISELDALSKDMKMSKNDILIDAFTIWRKAQVQKKIREGYKNAKNDPEWKELADMGLDDWNNQILEWEKN